MFDLKRISASGRAVMWVALSMTIATVACVSPPHPHKTKKPLFRLALGEAILGTGGKDNWEFHRLSEDPYGLGLKFPGYVIGLEKSDQETLDIDDEKWLDLKRSPFRSPEGKDELERILHRNRRTARRAFLSHILSYEIDDAHGQQRIRPERVYDAYTDFAADSALQPSPYSRGREELSRFGRHELATKLLEKQITHIIVYTMGWNTDQEEAIRNFNSLGGRLIAATSPTFRPLILGVTWDSKAGGNPLTRAVSYFFKADDADEAGAIWINWLLRAAVLPAAESIAERDVRVVLIGHSLGARALSTALVSHPLLRDQPLGVGNDQIDLLLGLQGAFSLNRFIPGGGWEGAPLKDWNVAARKIVLTWSINDTATPTATPITGAKHVGGWPGRKHAMEYEMQPDGHHEIFECRTWGWEDCPRGENCRGALQWIDGPPSNAPLVALVDVSQIVKHKTHNKGGKAHSDIYSKEMAEFIFDLITRFAPTDNIPRESVAVAADHSCRDVPWPEEWGKKN